MNSIAKVSASCLNVTMPIVQAIIVGFFAGMGFTAFQVFLNLVVRLLSPAPVFPQL